ncbi:MAG: DUF1013 domain-containing protein [Holosporales bacterium]|jgi:hypothetical protein|nr:DUF1013 domain-containing protein [Holosporales bacterium]
MTQPLMPKATAIWLIDNTSLTFDQIADFCNLHILEVEAIADGEADHMTGFDPIASSQLSQDEIVRCEADPSARLVMLPAIDIERVIKTNKAKYTPVVKRKDKPSAILWLIRYYPNLSDFQICKFIGTTRATVQGIRNKTHWNFKNIEPHSPVALGFCQANELEQLIKSQ